MKFGQLLPGIISAGSGIFGSLLQARNTRRENRRSRDWSERMYKKQFDDNIAFWNMQNEYNHPENQAKRLEAAGLNKALMYGGSAAGASGLASPIKTPDIQSAQFRSPDFGGIESAGMNFLNAMYNLEIKQAQVDNLRAQNTVQLEEALLKESQRKRNVFDLDFEKGLSKVSADFRKQNLEMLKHRKTMDLSENERKQAALENTLLESAERILNMRAQRANTKQEKRKIEWTIKNMKKDYKLKDMDVKMRQLGINPSDPMYFRILGRMLSEFSEELFGIKLKN